MIPIGERRISFNISVNDDSILEGNETFVLNIHKARRISASETDGKAIVTIVDNDSTLYTL